MSPRRLTKSRSQRVFALVVGLSILSLLSLSLALTAGNFPLSWSDYLGVLQGTPDRMGSKVLLELRLPRVLSAFAVGGLLALSGTVLQVILRNPLAEPYVLGISGGASCFALAAMWIGVGAVLVHISAFAGAVFSTTILLWLARGRGVWSPTRLLLTGVILASGWGALISFILSVAPEHNLRNMLFWLMGDIRYATASGASLWMLLAGLGVSMWFARALNVLAVGQVKAQTLGLSVDRLQWQMILLVAMLTTVAVTQAGSIGFVGLVVPHLLRLVGIHDHRVLLPGSVLLGGSLLVLADTAARTLSSDLALPTGIFTAVLGVPLFLLLLQRHLAQQAQ